MGTWVPMDGTQEESNLTKWTNIKGTKTKDTNFICHKGKVDKKNVLTRAKETKTNGTSMI